MGYNYTLFNAISDAVEKLVDAQQVAEEIAITEPQVFFWHALGTNRCGLVKAEDSSAAFALLEGKMDVQALELKHLLDNECFYEAEIRVPTGPKSSQPEG